MRTGSFATTVPGKWILAGEHAVLRGSPALVFPLHSRALQLEFHEDLSASDLHLELTGSYGPELQLLFWGVLERACELQKFSRQDMRGRVRLHSEIPVGAGLGASAALSVAVTRWLVAGGVVPADQAFEFGRSLENLFHGESSGVDVAVALNEKPLRFVRGGPMQFFELKFKPQIYVSYSGKRGVTMDCVKKVKDLLVAKPEWGASLDQKMREAVALAEKALLGETPTTANDRLGELVHSFDLALQCFAGWDLIGGEPQRHMQWLRESGAVAVKPTGSGNGGYVASLWSETPGPNVLSQLIPGL